MLSFVVSRQVQIHVWSRLRFLDEPVQQNHSMPRVDVKQHACDSVLRQSSPHFKNPFTQRPATGHPNGPPKLNGLYIFADTLAILGRG